jgi:hypothetical protein
MVITTAVSFAANSLADGNGVVCIEFGGFGSGSKPPSNMMA